MWLKLSQLVNKRVCLQRHLSFRKLKLIVETMERGVLDFDFDFDFFCSLFLSLQYLVILSLNLSPSLSILVCLYLPHAHFVNGLLILFLTTRLFHLDTPSTLLFQAGPGYRTSPEMIRRWVKVKM